MATSQSARAISVTAGASVTPNLFVTLQSDGKFDPAGLGDDADGVVLEAGSDGDRVPMVVPDGCVIPVVASAAILAGANVASAAGGQAVTAGTGNVILGKALTAADGSGELVEVLFSKAGAASA